MAVKVYMSTQSGAPTINGTAGSLITALDAILVNGYGSVSVTSITRASTTATVTTGTAHGLSTGDTALIAGAVETDYNGQFVITVASTTVFTYTVAGSPTTPATGTITSKRAPAGFTKSFSGTNKAVYRSDDVTGLRHYWRVLDAGGTGGGGREAVHAGYVTMSDVDTGTDIFPTTAQYPSGFFLGKSTVADTSGRHWVVITDGKTVYGFFFADTTTASGNITAPNSCIHTCVFGDMLSFRAGDIYSSVTGGVAATTLFSTTVYNSLFNGTTSITNGTASTSVPILTSPRDYTAVAGARAMQAYGSGLGTTLGASAYLSYPHMIDNGFYMAPVLLTQGTPALIRGRLPGYFEPLHANCFPNVQIIENVQGYSGRRFMMLWGKNASTVGSCVIDITGPWDS